MASYSRQLPSVMTVTACLTAAASALALGCSTAHAQATPNEYTTYTVTNTRIAWITCGSTAQDEGCFDSGQLTSFGKVCAILTSPEDKIRNTVTQYLYVIDSNYRRTGNVFLHVIKKEDVFTNSSITTNFSVIALKGLPLNGGADVTCSAAANSKILVAGTNSSTQAAIVQKSTLAISSYGGFSPPETISSIVADDRGYISITQGRGSFTGFYLLGPGGSLVADGGGTALVFNSSNAYVP